MSNTHLDDVWLNEYLDNALEPSARAQAQAHLADCRDCAARLMELRTLFADLETLPDLPLERDLTPGVLAVARRRSRPEPLAASPVLGLIFGLQTIVSISLLALALPLVAQKFQPLTTFQFGAQASIVFTHLLVTLNASRSALLTSAQNLVNQSVALAHPLPMLPFVSEAGLMLCLSAVSLLWLLGNGLLLRPRQSHARPQE